MDADHVFNAAVVAASFSAFRVAAAASDGFVPAQIKAKDRLRWKNIIVSFLHSFLSGVWAVACFHYEPALTNDLIHTKTVLAQTLVAFSYGYFLHDMLDMHRMPRKGYGELMLHHGVIGLAFGVALVTHLYLGYAALALVIELHNVFLHTRQLMNFLGYSMAHQAYRVNSFVNLLALVLIRGVTSVYMTRWLYDNAGAVPPVPLAIGGFGMTVINIMNAVLFYRLVQADWLTHKKPEKVAREERRARNAAANASARG
eukprot:TRINITY_DN6931_c0_g1_i1.p2 TRINITY_DN6931_c0_g1~~TRINITY_DN6931_c0_g1_i1.p2  ORF type:complete len:257 (+),score=117.33 TRINITY_DN6931_c0_g1_i1:85-855(+)